MKRQSRPHFAAAILISATSVLPHRSCPPRIVHCRPPPRVLGSPPGPAGLGFRFTRAVTLSPFLLGPCFPVGLLLRFDVRDARGVAYRGARIRDCRSEAPGAPGQPGFLYPGCWRGSFIIRPVFLVRPVEPLKVMRQRSDVIVDRDELQVGELFHDTTEHQRVERTRHIIHTSR